MQVEHRAGSNLLDGPPVFQLAAQKELQLRTCISARDTLFTAGECSAASIDCAQDLVHCTIQMLLLQLARQVGDESQLQHQQVGGSASYTRELAMGSGLIQQQKVQLP